MFVRTALIMTKRVRLVRPILLMNVFNFLSGFPMGVEGFRSTLSPFLL